MSNFIFKEMLLASFRERKARRIQFDPKVTIIRGNNETGKSSLIKSLVRTLGAEPAKVHPKWLEANVRSVVRFEVDAIPYAILRHGNSFAVFDGNGTALGQFQSVTRDLAPFLAKLFNFGLRLPDREGAFVALPPAYYLLPFYADQDASWSKARSGFSKLEQFSNWQRSVVEYHAGIRGNSFYEAQGKKLDAETRLNRLRRRRDGLKEVYAGLSKRFSAAQFNIDFSAYKQEVDELLVSCETLQKREEKYKAKVSALWNQSQILKTQLDIALHAREEAKLDFDYANSTGEHIDCPTCGAHYTNSFAERFSIAIDEDHCAGLALTLKDELSEVQRKLAVEVESSMKVAEELAAIEKLLAKREGEIALGDLIQQEGRRELREVMNDDLGGLLRAEGVESSRIHDAEQQMKSLDSRERRKEVNGFYETKMRLFLNDLDVQSVQDKAIKKVDGTISDTGSELPRALLAQQFAMLHVIKKFGSAAFAPILLDSPNQQDQDDRHLDRILRFIRDRRPASTQLILALVDTPGVDFGGHEVVLDTKHRLLQEEDFAEVGNEVQEFIDAALSS
jgi:hypothetical protein